MEYKDCEMCETSMYCSKQRRFCDNCRRKRHNNSSLKWVSTNKDARTTLLNSDKYKKYKSSYDKSKSRVEYRKKYRNTDSYKRKHCYDVIRHTNKRKQIKEVFTMQEWHKKLDNTDGICPMCKRFIGKEKLTLDHIYPISKAKHGRVYTIDDIQPLCRSCNCKKGARIE